MELIVEILIKNGDKFFARASENLNLKSDDFCVIKRDFYMDFGKVVQILGDKNKVENINELPIVQRKATAHDVSHNENSEEKAKSAYKTAQNFISKLKLDMKLLNAHYSLDGKLVKFQFTAEGRVDFRELVKQLSHALSTRIELRQIGVRDETSIVGGIGVCGRELCCASYIREFASINVKMAKDQDLSLTPSTISGVCGRLKCCLNYEHDSYKELNRKMPKCGDICECSSGKGRICDRNLSTGNLLVKMDDTGNTVSCNIKDVQIQSRKKQGNEKKYQDDIDSKKHFEKKSKEKKQFKKDKK